MPVEKSYQDEIGTKREYEIIVILKADSTKEEIKIVTTRIMDTITKKDGVLISIENWGRRRLAYEIKKNRNGIYLYLRVLGLYGMVPELERVLRLLEKVIRYQTIILDSDVDPSARPSELDDDMIEAATEIEGSQQPKKEAAPAEKTTEEATDKKVVTDKKVTTDKKVVTDKKEATDKKVVAEKKVVVEEKPVVEVKPEGKE
jgi:small subunit ribosomal protein S6